MSNKSQQPVIPAGHLGYLDGLRALAALEVVLMHAGMQTNWSASPPTGLTRAAMWPMSFGREAVALFIVLSGFCLTLPVVRHGGELRGGAWLFFKRRARRILPPYYFALGLSLLMVWTVIGQKTHTHWDACLPATGKAIWAHLLLLQDLFTDTSAKINHVMWSISVEWRIYFLFPILLFFWRRAGAIKTTLAVLAASYLLVRGLQFSWLNTGAFGLCPQFIGLFGLGMFGAGVAYSAEPRLASLRERVPWKLAMFLFLIAFIIGRQFPVWRGVAMPWYLRDYVIGLCAMSLMVLAATNSASMTHRLLSWKPLAFIGTFGYSLYLMHAPVQQALCQYLIVPLNLPPVAAYSLLASAGTAGVVLLCYVFFWFCERPFLNTPAPGLSRQMQSPPAEVAAWNAETSRTEVR